MAGDKVTYVPGLEFARDKLADGSFLFGYRATDKRTKEARELTQDELKRFLAGKAPHLSNPTPTEPRQHWPAVVAEAHADGTADLIVQSHQAGITHGVKRVPARESRVTTPGHCYPAE